MPQEQRRDDYLSDELRGVFWEDVSACMHNEKRQRPSALSEGAAHIYIYSIYIVGWVASVQRKRCNCGKAEGLRAAAADSARVEPQCAAMMLDGREG
jgi:hypothetical protein